VDLANQLVEELKQIGMQDVTIDDKATSWPLCQAM
jgi:hypothetical protein